MKENKDSVAGCLRSKEKHFSDLIAILSHGVEEIDLKGTITFSNKALSKMLGYKGEEIVGKKIWELLANEQDAADLKKYFNNLVKLQPKPTPYVTTRKHKDGSEVIIHVVWTYEYGENGKLSGFISVLTNITDRQKAEERKKLLAAEKAIYDARFGRLTPRETETMYLMAQGDSTKQIGKEMDISPRTVDIHRKRVMDKMELGSVAELARYITIAQDHM